MKLTIDPDEPTAATIRPTPKLVGPDTWCLYCRLGEQATCDAFDMPFCDRRRAVKAAEASPLCPAPGFIPCMNPRNLDRHDGVCPEHIARPEPDAHLYRIADVPKPTEGTLFDV